MRKKILFTIGIICFVLIGVMAVQAVEGGCCKPVQDCCCPDYSDFGGPELEEYICVCLDGKLIDGKCIYVWYPPIFW
jgi:hypothetical protein